MKKVILLGSSVDLWNNPKGKFIDTFDVIWRTNYNGYPKVIKTYPNIIGSKYGNWYCHDVSLNPFEMENSILKTSLDKDILNNYESILFNVFDIEKKQLHKICNLGRQFKFFKGWGLYNNLKNQKEIITKQENSIINCNEFFNFCTNNIYFQYLNNIKDCYSLLKKYNISLNLPPQQKPSSGLRMLTLLLKKYEHIHLMGFNGGKTGHWYPFIKNIKLYGYKGKETDIITKKNISKYKDSKHYLNLEFKLFKKLEEDNKVTIHE